MKKIFTKIWLAQIVSLFLIATPIFLLAAEPDFESTTDRSDQIADSYMASYDKWIADYGEFPQGGCDYRYSPRYTKGLGMSAEKLVAFDKFHLDKIPGEQGMGFVRWLWVQEANKLDSINRKKMYDATKSSATVEP